MNETWKIGAILIMVALIICGAVGYGMAIGMFKGEKGESIKGDKGNPGYTPIKGIDYFDGKDGKDAPINEPPNISLVYMTGEYTGILPVFWNHCKYTYGITFKIDDPEDETVRATVYFSENSTGIWNEIGSFFGVDGKHRMLQEFKYCVPQGKKTIYWLIEAWDGSDLATEVFSYTISP